MREAHRAAVTTALEELEKYTHARIGGNNPAEQTGKFIAAKFEHDTARPVNGYAAPQLHTHAIIFNVTERADGSTRALQPQALFESQNYATAVYQSALTYQLRRLGYEIEPGQSGAPEVKGYSQPYLDASSPRSQQIKEQMERAGFQGPEAAQIAAHCTRAIVSRPSRPKRCWQRIRRWPRTIGNQPERSRRRRPRTGLEPGAGNRRAFGFPRRSRLRQGESVRARSRRRRTSHHARGIAPRHGRGQLFRECRSEFKRRREEGEFRSVQGQKHSSGRSFTTPETIAAERANVQHVLNGQRRFRETMLSDRRPRSGRPQSRQFF